MTQQGAIAVSRFHESTSLLDCDIPTKNTFIHFSDRFNDEDVPPALFRRTRSAPADFPCEHWGSPDASRAQEGFNVESELAGSLAAEAQQELREPASEAREIAVLAAEEQSALKAAEATADRRLERDSVDIIAVKNTFIHFPDDEGLPPMRMCKSDWCGGASQLEALRPGLEGLLPESAGSAGSEGEKRGAGSCRSSCSTSPSPSAGRRSWSHETAAPSSDSTDVGEALDEAEDDSSECAFSMGGHLAREETQSTSLETRGASFETHQSGKCQPCFYFSFKEDGCRKGADCIYCHFCSLQESRQRKRAAKAMSKELKRAYGGKCC